MKIISIDPLTLEFTPEERVLEEWHSSLLDRGQDPMDAVNHIMEDVSPSSQTAKLLADGVFRTYLDTIYFGKEAQIVALKAAEAGTPYAKAPVAAKG